MNESLQKALYNYIQDPLNDVYNFDIGFEYHKIGQKAAALSYFLRTAEISHNPHLAYEAFLLNAQNFRQQGKRDGSTLNQLLHAIALVPSRPEAYFQLSRHYEETKKWHESFTIAEMGLKMANLNPPPFRTTNAIDYPGKYGLMFQKAVAAWWIDRPNYSRQLLRGLLNDYVMEDKYVNTCRHNLEKIKYLPQDGNIYVNPAWNLGVDISIYKNICISNDDILFNTDVFDWIQPHIDKGVIGMWTGNYYGENVDKPYEIQPIGGRPWGWGCLIFIQKDNWVRIDERLKIACGDDWLIHHVKGGGYQINNMDLGHDEISITTRRGEFFGIQQEDIQLWSQYLH